MPLVEVIYARDKPLEDARVREFATQLRVIFSEVMLTLPEQLRMTVQRVPIECTMHALDKAT